MKTNTMKAMAGMLMCVAGLALTPSRVSAGPMGFSSYNDPFDGFNPYESNWPSFGDDSPFGGLQFFGDGPSQGNNGPTITFNPAPQYNPNDTNLFFTVTYSQFPQFQSLQNESQNLDVDPPQVPEPASMLLIGTGLLGIAARARKRFGRQAA